MAAPNATGSKPLEPNSGGVEGGFGCDLFGDAVVHGQ